MKNISVNLFRQVLHLIPNGDLPFIPVLLSP